jgi:hypothetical protein
MDKQACKADTVVSVLPHKPDSAWKKQGNILPQSSNPKQSSHFPAFANI